MLSIDNITKGLNNLLIKINNILNRMKIIQKIHQKMNAYGIHNIMMN